MIQLALHWISGRGTRLIRPSLAGALAGLACLAWPASRCDGGGRPDERPPAWTADLPPLDGASGIRLEPLEPIDAVRPVLEGPAADEAREIEARIAELEDGMLGESDRSAQDDRLNAAIVLATRLVELRETHQGSASVRGAEWEAAALTRSERDGLEHANVIWHEVVDARQRLEDLRSIRSMSPDDRATLAGIQALDRRVVDAYSERRYDEAIRLAEQQLEAELALLGAHHPDTFETRSNIGIVSLRAGAPTRGIGHQEIAYAERLDTLGPEHPHTLVSGGNLARLLQELNRLDEAEAIAAATLRGRRAVLGEEHPLTLTSMNNMGFVLLARGKLDVATVFYLHTLERRRRVLGDEHPATLISINNMGDLLHRRGRLHEALPFVEQAMAGRRAVHGDTDPRTLRSIGNLVTVMMDLGRYSDAEPLVKELLSTNQALHGDDAPDTLVATSLLGILRFEQGRYEDAEPLYRRTLDGRRRVLGNEHTKTLESINNMGVLRQMQGRLAEAESYYLEALAGRRAVLGPRHHATLVVLDNLGWLLASRGRLNEAETYYVEALAGFRESLGDRHLDTLVSLGRLGLLRRMQGRLDESERCYAEALRGYREELGPVHRSTLIAEQRMAAVLEAQGRLVEAERAFERAIEGIGSALGDDHDLTMDVHHSMAALLIRQDRLDEAEVHLERVLIARRSTLGDVHPRTLSAIGHLATLRLRQGRLDEAEQSFAEALDLAERLRTEIAGSAADRALYSKRLALVDIAEDYAAMLGDQGRWSEALAVLERGRGRAILDLVGREPGDLAAAVRTQGDPSRVARYEAAVEAERASQAAVREIEARIAAFDRNETLDEALFDELQRRRRDHGERTRAIFVELGDLVPAVLPRSGEQIASAIGADEAVLSFAWGSKQVLAIVARDGAVTGVKLSSGPREVERLHQDVRSLRAALAARPASLEPLDARLVGVVSTALMPAELQRALEGVRSLMIVPDGPLNDVPLELILPQVPIGYAASATIAVSSWPDRSSSPGPNAGAVVLGDPWFDQTRSMTPDHDAPESGLFVSTVVEGSNADLAGVLTGDVLVAYDGQRLRSTRDLSLAMGAVGARSSDGADVESVSIELWRDGEAVELALRPGTLGIRPSRLPVADAMRSAQWRTRSSDEQTASSNSLDHVRLHGGRLAPLPGTFREARLIASMIDGSVLLTGETATAPTLRAHCFDDPPRILHLATHGLTGNAERPYEASLALTRPGRPTPDDIGFLTLDELLSRWLGRLRGTGLVTLSACDTGRGIAQGDSIMALPTGFLAAGAETVVASLWPVDDAATALLMGRFYENLLGRSVDARAIDGVTYPAGRPLPKLAALREARRWLRSLTLEQARAAREALELSGLPPSANPITRGVTPLEADPTIEDHRPYEHPYFWAGFVLFGAP